MDPSYVVHRVRNAVGLRLTTSRLADRLARGLGLEAENPTCRTGGDSRGVAVRC